MDSNYDYTPLQPGSIRLLFMSDEDPLQGFNSLQEVALDSACRFRAISYFWGDSALTHSIKCDDQKMPITGNVAQLLSADVFHTLDEYLPVWIDAICINQSDNAEKADQVAIMHRIYSMAEEVLVWLGPPTHNSDLAMNVLGDLGKKPELKSYGNIEALTAEAQRLLQLPGVQEALGSFFIRPWFQRLWVIQELVLAKHARMACGGKKITWQELASAVNASIHLQPYGFGFLFRVDEVETAMRAIQGVGEIDYVDSEAKKSDGKNFTALMDVATRRDVTNPRDRVYGMLGLASSYVRDHVQIDYSDQSEEALLELYIDTAKVAVRDDFSLSLLYIVTAAPRDPRLPSWCPNFGVRWDARLILSPDWRAGISRSGDSRLAKSWFEPGSDALYAPGYIADTVASVVSSTFSEAPGTDFAYPPLEHAQNNLEWITGCQNLLKRIKPDENDDAPIWFLLTLSEGLVRIPFTTEDSLRQAYHRLIEIWSSAVSNTPLPSTTEFESSAALNFNQSLAHNCKGRKVFSTTGGRMGTGPADTAVGDKVCILYGAGSQYMLRLKEDDSGRLLGSAYVHYFKVFDDVLVEDKAEERVFVIE